MLFRLTSSAVASLAFGSSALAAGLGVVPGRYIVEFDDSVPVSQPVSAFYSGLSADSISAVPGLDFSHRLFNGASFDLAHPAEEHDGITTKIASLATVKSIWPVRQYSRPEFKSTVFPASDASNALKRRDDPSATSDDTYPVHAMGGVDKVRDQGYTGSGLFVAIVDTGVDYKHPALGGGFGAGFKIAHGYDFAGDAYNGTNTAVPKADPYSQCNPHGTHVSGIVGANANEYNFTGVVPDATLGMYKVFGCAGTVGNDLLIAAFLKAQQDGADVITASIGGASGWEEDPWAVVTSRIVAAGTPISIAAGNDGATGAFYASGAADAVGAISVGSVDSVLNPVVSYLSDFSVGSNTSSNSSSQQWAYTAGEPAYPSVALQLWSADYNTSVVAGGCSPYPAGTPDLSNKLVLIRRGSCTFVQKAQNAAAFGAKYILFYNNVEGTISTEVTTVPGILGVAMVTPEQGAAFIGLLAAGNTVNVDVKGAAVAQISVVIESNNVTGGYMSTYTSWGPTFEGRIKPEVSAPGGNILSTWPLTLGGYASISGTSMATPFIAGCITLILQVRGKISPAVISALLSSTATPVTWNNGTAAQNPFLAPPIQQGGGLVNVFDAVNAATILSTTALEFNDTANFAPSLTFSILNSGDDDLTYTLSDVGAASVYTLPGDGTIVPSVFPPDLTQDYATVSFDSDTVVVGAGQTQNVTVTVTPPAALAAARIPVYNGYIYVNASNGETFSLPYAGVATSLKTAAVIDTQDGFPFLTSSTDPSQAPLNTTTTFTINQSINASASTGAESVPVINIMLALGTDFIDVHVVPPNGTSLGSIPGFPATAQPRANAITGVFAGQLANQSYVPAGTYSLVATALKILGDPANAADYETASSIPFKIAYTS